MATGLPTELVAAADLAGATSRRLRGRSDVWRVDHPMGAVVIRRNDPVRHPPVDATVTDDIGWVHRFLGRLAASAFPAPRPAPLFAGRSVAVFEGAVWEALAFVPGRVVGWSPTPTMFQLGAFLASFHEATAELESFGDRASVLPVASLVGDVPWRELKVVKSERHAVQASVEALASELDATGHRSAPRSVIHGDFTNHNVVASGRPRVPSGAIDFANAYTEATLADVGFALWRSGRPSQGASGFDAERIAAYVAGYQSRRSLDPGGGAAILAYLRARGLQILAKQVRHGGPVDLGPLPRLTWLADHQPRLLRRLEAWPRSGIGSGPRREPQR